MNRSITLRGRLVVVVLAVVAAGTLVGAAPSSAATPVGAAGCAPVVQLQSLTIPKATGPRRSAPALLPDDGGALPPVVTVLELRTATTDELDLVIGTGSTATVRLLYVAPDGCRITWSRNVHPVAMPAGRRSVHTPAFTVRLTSVAMPACSRCMRMV